MSDCTHATEERVAAAADGACATCAARAASGLMVPMSDFADLGASFEAIRRHYLDALERNGKLTERLREATDRRELSDRLAMEMRALIDSWPEVWRERSAQWRNVVMALEAYEGDGPRGRLRLVSNN